MEARGQARKLLARRLFVLKGGFRRLVQFFAYSRVHLRRRREELNESPNGSQTHRAKKKW